MSDKLPEGDFHCCKDWIEGTFERMEKDQFTLFMVLLWNLWNRRNKWIQDAQLIPQKLIVDYAQLLVTDFLNAKEDPIIRRENQRTRRWSKPLLNTIKVNVDGAFRVETGEAAIGLVARNHQGLVVDGTARKLQGAHTAATAEACAFKEGIHLAIENGDASNIVAMLTAKELDYSVAATHLLDVVEILKAQPGFSFAHVGRNSNRVAHGLAQWAISHSISFRFDFDVPICIQD